jgi:hypothetical protein
MTKRGQTVGEILAELEADPVWREARQRSDAAMRDLDESCDRPQYRRGSYVVASEKSRVGRLLQVVDLNGAGDPD